MASGSRGFSVQEVLDILDDSADGECTIDDEPVMEGSDDEFEDILFEEEEDYNVLHQSPDSFIDTEERHTPSPTPLPLPISIVTPPLPIHSTPTNTQSSIVQTPTTSILPIHSTPMNTQSSIIQTPTTSILTIHSTPMNTQSSIIQTPTTSILPIHSTPMNTQPAQVQTPTANTQQPSQVHMPPNTHQIPTTWSKILHSVPIHPFTSSVGPTFTITESPLDVFSHFFTDELIDEIVKQSNLYASHVMGNEKYNEWDKITVSDLKAYFGFYILMGINHLPSIHDYWRVDPFVRFSPIADRITRNRFKEITRYLHFVDNTQLQKRGEPNYDRLGKIRPIMLICKQKFLSNYEPNCEQAIDEAMIPFQGRSAIKQYLPMKPIKRGLKVWVRADSHHGYFSDFSVYEGQSESAGSSQDGLGMRVVKSLTRHLVGKFHHIYFDNFFSSPKLLHDLLQDGIYACGTVRVNRRGWPNELKNKTKKYIRDYLKLEKR